MKTRLVQIGSSKGIRIPKPLIEQAGLRDEVDVTVRGDAIIVRPLVDPRDGWAEAFQEMAKRGDDVLLDEVVATEWDASEWEW